MNGERLRQVVDDVRSGEPLAIVFSVQQLLSFGNAACRVRGGETRAFVITKTERHRTNNRARRTAR